MNPFFNDHYYFMRAFLVTVGAILVCYLLPSCAAIPYRVSVSYSGATASYDGKRVLLDVNGDEVGKSLRGYAK